MADELVSVDGALKAEMITWIEYPSKNLKGQFETVISDFIKTLREESKVRKDVLIEFMKNRVTVDEALKERLIAVLYYNIQLWESVDQSYLPERKRTVFKLKQALETLKETSIIKQFYVDSLEEDEKQIKQHFRLHGQTVRSYNFPVKAKEYWASNYNSLIDYDMAREPLTIDNVTTFLTKMDLGDLITLEVINETVSYFNPDCEHHQGHFLFLPGPYKFHVILKDIISQGVDTVRHTIQYFKSWNKSSDYNLIISIGSGMKGNEILFIDDMFRDRFLVRDTVIFVFENSIEGIFHKNTSEFYFLNYLKKYYSETIKTTEIVENLITCYTFVYKTFTIDLVHINSYYISIYKPFMKSIVELSKKSLFVESMYSGSVLTFTCDLFVYNYFDYYLHSMMAGTISFTTGYILNYQFLINLDKMKKSEEDVRKDLGNIRKSKGLSTAELRRKIESDPRYKGVIRYVGHPDFWTILEDESVALGSSSSSGTASSSGGINGGRRRRTRKKIIGRRTSRKH